MTPYKSKIRVNKTGVFNPKKPKNPALIITECYSYHFLKTQLKAVGFNRVFKYSV